ncbi:hypothetical protein GCM10009551_075430 [Nocardiopsis tropica]
MLPSEDDSTDEEPLEDEEEPESGSAKAGAAEMVPTASETITAARRRAERCVGADTLPLPLYLRARR